MSSSGSMGTQHDITRQWSSVQTKRSEVLTQATALMKPENIMLSLKRKKKKKQTQKVTYCMVAFIEK